MEALYLLPIPQPAPVKCFFQHSEALRIEPPVIYIPRIYPGAAGVRLVPCQQAVLYQEVQINEIGIPGKGGKALVGGVAEARLAQGQHLPAPLTGGVEKVGKVVGGPAQGADAVG